MPASRFCSTCGGPTSPAMRFCPNCGTPVAAVPATEDDIAVRPTTTPSPPSRSAVIGAHALEREPGETSAREAGPTSARPSGMSRLDTLLGGDWGGAAIAAAGCVGVMSLLALAAALMILGGAGGAREAVVLTALSVAAAFGGDVHLSGSAYLPLLGSGSGRSSLGLLPLTLTFTGLSVLGGLYGRRLTTTGARALDDALMAAVRTLAVLAALMFAVALLSRVSANGRGDGPFEGAFAGTLSAGMGSTLVGTLLFGAAALAITIAITRHRVLPARLQAVRGLVAAPLFAAVLVFTVGLIAAVGLLLYTLSTETQQAQQLAAAILALPNAAIAVVLMALGVPVRATSWGGGLFGDLDAAEGDSLSLLNLAERVSLWYWLVPVMAGLVIISAAVVLVLRQNTLPDARKEGLRFAGALAAVSVIATLLVRVSGSVAISSSDSFGRASLSFNPALAALLAAIWGFIAVVVAPLIAAKLSPGAVTAVRRRFGTAQPHSARPRP